MNTSPYPELDSKCADLNCTWSTNCEASELLDQVVQSMHSQELTPNWATLYATNDQAGILLPILESAGAWLEWPLMVLITPGDTTAGGFQAICTSSPFRVLRDKGRVVGMVWEEPDGVEKLSLCGLLPAAGLGPADSTTDLLKCAEVLLSSEGYCWTDVYRTWYYNEEILEWYDAFNDVRTKIFREAGMAFVSAPASTGIGLVIESGVPLTLAFFASKAGTRPGPVPSPLQNAAMDYGSLFSRASEELSDDSKRLWISGTADIDPKGNSCHLGDFTAQTLRTYEIVRAILNSRDMDWADVCRATAYVREPSDVATFDRLVASGRLPKLQAIVIPATVCRDDLLFELELDASLDLHPRI